MGSPDRCLTHSEGREARCREVPGAGTVATTMKCPSGWMGPSAGAGHGQGGAGWVVVGMRTCAALVVIRWNAHVVGVARQDQR